MAGKKRVRSVLNGRRIVVVLAAVIAAWVAFAAAAQQVLRPTSPSLGLLYFVNTQARAEKAAELALEGTSSRQWHAARIMALSVLRREPGNVTAIRTMSFVAAADGNKVLFTQWLNYGESLSRRDVETQIALIENNVSSGNVAGALKHYNRALLTEVNVRDKLIPILVKAADNPVVADEIFKTLRPRPAWWPAFVAALNGSGSNPTTIARLLQALRLNIGNESERTTLGLGIERMLALGDVDGAFAFYRGLRGNSSAELVRDGRFERSDAFGPFEWKLTDDAGRSASRQTRPDGRGLALFLTTDDGGGDVAWQSLLLAPGHYVLSLRAVRNTDTAPEIQIAVRCAVGGLVLAQISAKAVDNVYHMPFSVPDGCRPATLAIAVSPGSPGQAAGWVDDVVVARLRSR